MSLLALGMGNPLLDISAEVPVALLEKYSLKPSDAILAEEKHLPLYEELVKDHDVHYVPGGSALNTMRTAQWFTPGKGQYGYFGCVGIDANAEILKRESEKAGLKVHFCVDDKKPTGTCAALVTNHKRSLVANLAAAEQFKIAHVAESTSMSMLDATKVIYVTSFFLTHSPDAAMEVAKVAKSRNIPFVMNISAPFLVQVPIFKERVLALLEYADYVFCNNDEAAALGAAMEWGVRRCGAVRSASPRVQDDLAEVARKTAALPKANGARARRVVFTHGGDPAIVVGGDCTETKEYPVIPLADGELVDENGAGDAYVGGFLAGLAQGWAEKQCFAAASYCAWVVIRRHGCALPETKEPKEHMGFKFP